MSVGTAVTLPPIVLEQELAIGAALALAAGWESEAATLDGVAAYTRIHGTSMVADRYSARAAVLTSHATALRRALAGAEADTRYPAQDSVVCAG